MFDFLNRPFVIEHQRLQETPQGFVPAARLIVSPHLRESGLLSLISDKQARLLLALCTFVSPNGQIQATADQVAKSLGVPTPLAALWLLQFSHKRFHGMHLVYRIKREEGHPFYTLSRSVISHEHQQRVEAPVLDTAGREAVIAHSRAAYTAPRAEVERGVMLQLGHAVEELFDTPEGAAWRGLHIVGIPKDDIKALIKTYGIERILQQISWLPERRAKSPARYLIAAIKGNYGPPMRLRDTLTAPRHVPVGSTLPLPLEAEEKGDHEQ